MYQSPAHELNCKDCDHTASCCAYCKNGNLWKPVFPEAEKYILGYKNHINTCPPTIKIS